MATDKRMNFKPNRMLKGYIYTLYRTYNIPLPPTGPGKQLTEDELWGNFIVQMSGHGGGNVISVNGKTGVVVLNAGDVNAYNKSEIDLLLAQIPQWHAF
jgi:hypothetical protein